MREARRVFEEVQELFDFERRLGVVSSSKGLLEKAPFKRKGGVIPDFQKIYLFPPKMESFASKIEISAQTSQR